LPVPKDLDAKYANTVTQYGAITLEPLANVFERDRPSLLIYNSPSLAARILGHRYEIPLIKASATVALDATNLGKQMPDERFRQSVIDYGRGIDPFVESHGVSGAGYTFHREKLNIYLFTSLLQPYRELFDSSCFFAGRCAGEQPHYGSWERGRTNGKPIIFVATSTNYVQGPAYFRMCIDALSDAGARVILSIGDTGTRAALGDLPPDFEVVQHTAHVKILPYVSLYICLGGNVTASEAAYHGVPMIVISGGWPELEWQAEHLEKTGLALHLKKADSNTANLRDAVRRVSSDRGMQERAREIKRFVRREPGSEEAANVIEDYLDGEGKVS